MCQNRKDKVDTATKRKRKRFTKKNSRFVVQLLAQILSQNFIFDAPISTQYLIERSDRRNDRDLLEASWQFAPQTSRRSRWKTGMVITYDQGTSL